MIDKQRFMIDMGNRVKAQREKIGITQVELSRKLGYKNKASISRIEAGQNEIPQSKMQAFADALDTSVAYLMGWNETDLPDEEDNFPIREQMRNEMRILFDAAEDAPASALLEAAALLMRYKEQSGQ